MASKRIQTLRRHGLNRATSAIMGVTQEDVLAQRDYQSRLIVFEQEGDDFVAAGGGSSEAVPTIIPNWARNKYPGWEGVWEEVEGGIRFVRSGLYIATVEAWCPGNTTTNTGFNLSEPDGGDAITVGAIASGTDYVSVAAQFNIAKADQVYRFTVHGENAKHYQFSAYVAFIG